jgi:hypothetical protein
LHAVTQIHHLDWITWVAQVQAALAGELDALLDDDELDDEDALDEEDDSQK